MAERINEYIYGSGVGVGSGIGTIPSSLQTGEERKGAAWNTLRQKFEALWMDVGDIDDRLVDRATPVLDEFRRLSSGEPRAAIPIFARLTTYLKRRAAVPDADQRDLKLCLSRMQSLREELLWIIDEFTPRVPSTHRAIRPAVDFDTWQRRSGSTAVDLPDPNDAEVAQQTQADYAAVGGAPAAPGTADPNQAPQTPGTQPQNPADPAQNQAAPPQIPGVQPQNQAVPPQTPGAQPQNPADPAQSAGPASPEQHAAKIQQALQTVQRTLIHGDDASTQGAAAPGTPGAAPQQQPAQAAGQPAQPPEAPQPGQQPQGAQQPEQPTFDQEMGPSAPVQPGQDGQAAEPAASGAPPADQIAPSSSAADLTAKPGDWDEERVRRAYAAVRQSLGGQASTPPQSGDDAEQYPPGFDPWTGEIDPQRARFVDRMRSAGSAPASTSIAPPPSPASGASPENAMKATMKTKAKRSPDRKLRGEPSVAEAADMRQIHAYRLGDIGASAISHAKRGDWLRLRTDASDALVTAQALLRSFMSGKKPDARLARVFEQALRRTTDIADGAVYPHRQSLVVVTEWRRIDGQPSRCFGMTRLRARAGVVEARRRDGSVVPVWRDGMPLSEAAQHVYAALDEYHNPSPRRLWNEPARVVPALLQILSERAVVPAPTIAFADVLGTLVEQRAEPCMLRQCGPDRWVIESKAGDSVFRSADITVLESSVMLDGDDVDPNMADADFLNAIRVSERRIVAPPRWRADTAVLEDERLRLVRTPWGAFWAADETA